MYRSGYRPLNIMDRRLTFMELLVLKTAFAWLLIHISLIAPAQDNNDHRYVAQLTGLWTEQHEKLLYDAVNGWEVVEQFKVSHHAHRLKFTASRSVSEGELSERLTGTGARVFWLADVQADGSLTGASYQAHAFPVFENTGDPTADNARYEADKAAWLAAHPGWVDDDIRSNEGTEAGSEK